MFAGRIPRLQVPEQLSVPLVTRATNLEDAGVEQERKSAPPPVFSAPPQQELEQELNRNPHDLDKKADVGSDESMDASDPPAAAQPGLGDDPVPSSGFPE